ncbi:MAG: lysophospholipid acyltransferase family protein [candidate division Zixibacteria bacterium]|nr:lysophospholipid acyltransferase family protein [candidate division Zixibacteria bacterium]
MSLKEKMFLSFVSILGPLFILLLGKSLKIKWIGKENLKPIREENGKVLYAFWHGRMLILSYSHRRKKIQVLISQHRDGEIIARIIERLGFGTVRGSSSHGGYKAILQMANKAKDGYDLAITPDGPKGPAFQVQPGTACIAQRSEIPILPITNSAEKVWTLKSWDRFIIPKPFSKVVIIIGKPIYIPGELTSEQIDLKNLELQENLNRLTEKADNYFKSGNNYMGK